MGYNEKAILHTIAYADQFEYPLNLLEIWKYLIVQSHKDKTISKTDLEKIISSLSSYISIANGYFCLKGREHIVKIRKERLLFSDLKRKKAQKIVNTLSFIPSILLIGVSGACAVDNATKDDDIDLFIITKEKTLWISRFVIIMLLQLYGVRRSRNQKNAKDTACVNMLIDERNLYLGKEREDVYTAHEIIQMRPLFDRNNTYNTFLAANRWVINFLPNCIITEKRNKQKKDIAFGMSLIVGFLKMIEPFAKYLQLWYINKHVSSETIQEGFLALHPFDYRKKILSSFEKIIHQYEKI